MNKHIVRDMIQFVASGAANPDWRSMGLQSIHHAWYIHTLLERAKYLHSEYRGGGWHIHYSVTPAGQALASADPFVAAGILYALQVCSAIRLGSPNFIRYRQSIMRPDLTP